MVIHATAALHCIGSGSLADPLYLLLEDPAKMKVSTKLQSFRNRGLKTKQEALIKLPTENDNCGDNNDGYGIGDIDISDDDDDDEA